MGHITSSPISCTFLFVSYRASLKNVCNIKKMEFREKTQFRVHLPERPVNWF